jgi:ABC-type transport system involved in multi-copper enzyme maturation permease subunit
MKTQYKALIIDTILKEIRSKTLIFIFVATTLAIILGHLVLSMVNANMAGADQGLGLAGINILSINFRILNSISFIIAAVFGVSVFRSDFENNIIYQYLAFPISRTEYFFIRVLGTWLLVLAYYAYAYILSTVLFSLAFKKVVLTSGHVYSFFILALYLLLVIFISIFFSLLMNKMSALFITFISCITAAAGYNYFSKLAFKEYFMDMGSFKMIGLIFYLFFPRITFLDSQSSILLLGEATTVNLWEQIIHLVVISGVYVFLASYFIKRKDF